MSASGPEFRTFRSSSLSIGRGIENSVSKSHNGGIFRKNISVFSEENETRLQLESVCCGHGNLKRNWKVGCQKQLSLIWPNCMVFSQIMWTMLAKISVTFAITACVFAVTISVTSPMQSTLCMTEMCKARIFLLVDLQALLL